MKPISVGDLVMVVRPTPCGCGRRLGMVFVCGEIIDQNHPGVCGNCKKSIYPSGRKTVRSPFTAGLFIAVERLKRIDPDALLDDVPTREELHA